MKASKLKKIEQLLLQERERTSKSLEALQPAGAPWLRTEEVGAAGASLQVDDGGRDVDMLRQVSLIADRERGYLDGIELALERLRESPESYGYCQSCGKEIPFDRLLVVPHTRYCLECKGGSTSPS